MLGDRRPHDPRPNIASIRLRDKAEQAETVGASERTNAALAPDGTIYGIELLNANHQLSGGELTEEEIRIVEETTA